MSQFQKFIFHGLFIYNIFVKYKQYKQFYVIVMFFAEMVYFLCLILCNEKSNDTFEMCLLLLVSYVINQCLFCSYSWVSLILQPQNHRNVGF